MAHPEGNFCLRILEDAVAQSTSDPSSAPAALSVTEPSRPYDETEVKWKKRRQGAVDDALKYLEAMDKYYSQAARPR